MSEMDVYSIHMYKMTNAVQMYMFLYTYTCVHTLTHTHKWTVKLIHLNQIKTCSNINIFIDTGVVDWAEF